MYVCHAHGFLHPVSLTTFVQLFGKTLAISASKFNEVAMPRPQHTTNGTHTGGVQANTTQTYTKTKNNTQEEGTTNIYEHSVIASLKQRTTHKKKERQIYTNIV